MIPHDVVREDILAQSFEVVQSSRLRLIESRGQLRAAQYTIGYSLTRLQEARSKLTPHFSPTRHPTESAPDVLNVDQARMVLLRHAKRYLPTYHTH